MGLKLIFVPTYCVACKIDEWLKQTNIIDIRALAVESPIVRALLS